MIARKLNNYRWIDQAGRVDSLDRPTGQIKTAQRTDVNGFVDNLIGYNTESGEIKTLYYGLYDFIPYTGNVIRTNYPKNQHSVREVWPFQLHTWNESTGEFELYMDVSGTYTDTSEKREMDKDKDGLVLSISYPDLSTDSDTTSYDSEFMDKADLEAEMAGLAGGIRPITVTYTDLTDETLNAFGQEMEQEENGLDFSAVSSNNLGLKSHDLDDYLYLDIKENGKVVFEYLEYDSESWSTGPNLVIFEGQLDDLDSLDGPSYKAVFKDIAKLNGEFIEENAPEFPALENNGKPLTGSDVYIYPAGCEARVIPEKHLEIANRNRAYYMQLIGTEKYLTKTIVILDGEQAAFY